MRQTNGRDMFVFRNPDSWDVGVSRDWKNAHPQDSGLARGSRHSWIVRIRRSHATQSISEILAKDLIVHGWGELTRQGPSEHGSDARRGGKGWRLRCELR